MTYWWITFIKSLPFCMKNFQLQTQVQITDHKISKNNSHCNDSVSDDVILQFSYLSHVTTAAKVACSLSLQKNTDLYTHDFKPAVYPHDIT